ncbi:MAG TPA: hypothetical protein VL486_00920 [Verrucomicrobiae bacterium]|nr:hypothetical protein [Verrucomicrobiae bacterium]
MKTKTTKQKRTGSDDLLFIADQANAIARRAEHLVTGRATARWYLALAVEDKDKHLNLLRSAQALRDAGVADPDLALASIYIAADKMAVEAAGADPKLDRVFDKLKVTLKAQGEAFDPNNHDAWSEELLAVSDKLERRWNEAYERHFVSILRRHGECEVADLYLNDNDAYWRRLEAGVRILLAGDPEALAELDEMRAKLDKLETQTQGDTPTSEVVLKG